MGYYRPVKVIASAGGGTGAGVVVISSETEPTFREDGKSLKNGDYWYKPSTDELWVYVDSEFVPVGGRQGVPGPQGPQGCLLYTSPSPRDLSTSRMPSSA